MSDFAADTGNFRSDFCTEANDYASDFCDFPGDYDSDFGREARPPPEAPASMERPRRQPQPIGTSSTGASHPAKGTGAAHDGGKLEAQAAMRGGVCNATPQGHKQGAQRTQSGGNVGTAARVKTPYRGVKMVNKAYGRKAPGIHREQRETPHGVSHAGRWSFLAFGQIEK